MQPMWLCFLWGKQFEDTFEDTQWRKVKQMHHSTRAIWRDIWKRTVEKSQTNATNVTMLPLRQAIWRHIWRHTAEKSQTDVTSVTIHLSMKALWRYIWKCIVEKSQTNATSVTMQYASSYGHVLRRHLKTHSEEKSNKCNQCDFVSSRSDSLAVYLKMHSREKPNNCKQYFYASSYAAIWGNIGKCTSKFNIETI